MLGPTSETWDGVILPKVRPLVFHVMLVKLTDIKSFFTFMNFLVTFRKY